MTTLLVKRPTRSAPPPAAVDPVDVTEPPTQQETPAGASGAAMLIMPVVGGAGSLTLALSNAAENLLIAVAALAGLVGAITVGVVMILSQRLGPKRLLRQSRERYLDYIEDLRRRLRGAAAAQRDRALWCHPPPSLLLDLARNDRRRWERRPKDPDFLCLRVGFGDQPLAGAPRMSADTGPLNQFDPLCLEAAMNLCERFAALHDAPRVADLRDVDVLTVSGDREMARRLGLSALCQLVTFHSYRDVRIGVVRTPQRAHLWDWVKWLPHVQSEDGPMDGDLPSRLVTTSISDMFDLLTPHIMRQLDERVRDQASTPGQHFVVIVDGQDPDRHDAMEIPQLDARFAELGLHLLVLRPSDAAEPQTVDEHIHVDGAGIATSATSTAFTVDAPPDGFPEAISRLLAPLRLSIESTPGSDEVKQTVELPEILGVPDPAALATAETWHPRSRRDLLRAPIGVGSDGRVVLLDLKESAHGGMGPHGMVVGATGSGKSELLRTLVASLAIGHPPDRLAMLLVDFKGGATFEAMRDVPHLAGMITNLQDDLGLVDRMQAALFGEITRRQEILKRSGNLPNVSAYQEMLDAGASLEPMPHLLVIIDEFSELLAARPDFADLFVAIGRVGRSVGIHLLLATQRLEMGKIRGLESHLSYRISLRTFSESESRDAIGVPDAYHLPAEPGVGYLKVDTTVFARFKAAMISGPYSGGQNTPKTSVPVVPYVAVNGLGAWLAKRPADQTENSPPNAGAPSVLDVVCSRLAASGATCARPVWLEPLTGRLTLDRLQDPSRTAAPATLEAVVGLVDDPSRQRQFPLSWDFTAADGNLVIAGAPQMGKSTVVRTLMSSLALRYAPGDVAFYCVDYGGGSLRGLQDLPHVASVASRLEPERITRTISEVVRLLEQREEMFRKHDIDSAAALRRARADGRVPEDLEGDIFLIVDGWGSFREDFETMEFTIGEVAARGLNYGVHVVLTVTQNMQVRMRMQSAFSGRIELRLTESYESTIGRKLMDQLSKDIPGRGLVSLAEGLTFQTALPRIDGRNTVEDLPEAVHALVHHAKSRWTTSVRPVQTLPSEVPVTDLPSVELGADLVPIGLSERALEPAAVSVFGSDPHLLVYGDGEAGKTNALRLLVSQLVMSRTAEQLAFVVADYRRGLFGHVPSEYLAAYCTSDQQTRQTMSDLAGAVRQRLPSGDITAEQLAERSWWSGVDIAVVIDDYDLVSTPSGNSPLGPLLEFLPQGRDLGLHLIVARRTGGLSRAMLEPVLQRLNDLQTPGLVLSGDRAEGRLVNGVVARRLPPGRAVYAPRGGGASQVQLALAKP